MNRVKYFFTKLSVKIKETESTKDIDQISEIELGQIPTSIPITPEPINDNLWRKIKTSMKNENIIDRLIIVLIIIAVILGIGFGFAFRSINLSEKDKVYFGFPGELWIRSLKFISIPLIFFNLITGISELYIEKDVKRIVLHMLLFDFTFNWLFACSYHSSGYILNSKIFCFLKVLYRKASNYIAPKIRYTVTMLS